MSKSDDNFDSSKYDSGPPKDWRSIRLDLINKHYPSEHFRGKKVLEVAAALGEIGAYFANELGANVTCTDHYEGWVNIIKERYPNIKSFVQDINEPWPDEKYDVIIHMGVIYHQPVEAVEIRLREACRLCDEIIIETNAIESDDTSLIIPVPKPPKEDWWEPVNTDYCDPSTAYIERILTEESMKFVRVGYTPQRFLWFGKRVKD